MCVHATHIKKIHTQTVHMSLIIFEHEMGIFELRNEDEKRKAFKISQRKRYTKNRRFRIFMQQ